MYFDLVSNALDVVFLCATVIWLDLNLRKKYSPYLLGVMFGLITVWAIKHRVYITEGHFYDFRNITMTMAGFVGGPLCAGVAAVVAGFCRYIMDENGYMPGITNILVFACFGSILRICLKKQPHKNERQLLFWLIIGAVMAGISLFIIAHIPPGEKPPANIPKAAAFILIINPLATTIIFNFYFRAYDFLSKTFILKTIMRDSPLNLMLIDNKSTILLSEHLEKLLQSSLKFTELFKLSNELSAYPQAAAQDHKEITTENRRHFSADFSRFQMPNDEYAWVAIVNDITDLRAEQEKLQKATEQLSDQLKLQADLARNNQLIADIINNMPDPFYALDNQWRFTFVNKKAEELFQKSRAELLEKVFWSLIPQAQGSLCELNLKKAKRDCLPITFEGQCFLNKDIWNQITAYPSQSGVSVYYRDITKQKIAHEDLVKSQKEISLILESMTDYFYALDGELRFTYINRAAEAIFGKTRDELIGIKITEAFKCHETALQHYHEVISEKKSVTFEIISEALANKYLELSLYPIENGENGVTCYFRDITSRKISQNEMARLDRLNLVGQLAAGIAHEVRNPITIVRGYLQLLSEKPAFSAQKSTFELMIAEVDRANSIITEFLSLARTKQSDLKLQNLNGIIQNLYPILQADTFTQNKQINFIPGEIPKLILNRNEISQLILNLVRNGLESMTEGGYLTIKSCREHDKVILEIEDEGCGIPLENLKKLGTPFFTTKDLGTGLGLATCFKIAESHNAKIQINSSPNGTSVCITFPIPAQSQEF